jgi:hypothetical protein
MDQTLPERSRGPGSAAHRNPPFSYNTTLRALPACSTRSGGGTALGRTVCWCLCHAGGKLDAQLVQRQRMGFTGCRQFWEVAWLVARQRRLLSLKRARLVLRQRRWRVFWRWRWRRGRRGLVTGRRSGGRNRSLLTASSGRFPVRGCSPLLSRVMDDQGERTPHVVPMTFSSIGVFDRTVMVPPARALVAPAGVSRHCSPASTYQPSGPRVCMHPRIVAGPHDSVRERTAA